jgi:hypothetical protein
MDIQQELAALRRLTVKRLRQRYAELFGEETPGRHKGWLVKRIAWRLQARAEGGLSERALRRAGELADDADLRLSPPRPYPAEATPEGPVVTVPAPPRSDDRLPPPGSVLTRKYKGRTLQVRVLDGGFEFGGQVYGSLSAVAKAVTGSHCNGFHFFRLGKGGSEQ